MTLKELINASGGPARCAEIWGMSRPAVSEIIKRNVINYELLEELIEHHRAEQLRLFEVMFGTVEIGFEITKRKTNRRLKYE